MLKKEVVKDFMKESLEKYGQETWLVGEVVKGDRKAILREDREIITIKESFLKF